MLRPGDGEITLDCLGTLSRKAGRQRVSEGGALPREAGKDQEMESPPQPPVEPVLKTLLGFQGP